jgi:hypothetical protein
MLSVMALMGVMLAMSVAPALAKKPQYSCTDGIRTVIVDKKSTANRLESEGATCTRIS